MREIMVGNVCVNENLELNLIYPEDGGISRESIPITLPKEDVEEIRLLANGINENSLGTNVGMVRGYYLFGTRVDLEDNRVMTAAETVSEDLAEIVQFLKNSNLGLCHNFFYIEAIEINGETEIDQNEVFNQVITCLPAAVFAWTREFPDLLICHCTGGEETQYQGAGYEIVASEDSIFALLPTSDEVQFEGSTPDDTAPSDKAVDVGILSGMLMAVAFLASEGYISSRKMKKKMRDFLDDPPLLEQDRF